MKLHSRSKFYNSHTFYKWLILEFREITVSNPGEKCKICLGITSVEPRSCWWHSRYFSEVMKSSKCQGCRNDLWSGSSFFCAIETFIHSCHEQTVRQEHRYESKTWWKYSVHHCTAEIVPFCGPYGPGLLLLGLKSPFWWSIIQEDKYCAAMCCAF